VEGRQPCACPAAPRSSIPGEHGLHRGADPPPPWEMLLCLQSQLTAEKRCRQTTVLSQEDYISDGKRTMVKTKAKIILTENP